MELADKINNNPASYRILVVDDSEIELKIYANALSPYFTLMFANSATEAWNLLNRAPLPDAIILDVMMPDEDGFGLCNRIKENSFTKDIPIIFISSLTGPTVRAQAFDMGGADFVTKPPAMSELIARLNRHISVYRKTKKLESMIYVDPLTHLPNGNKFREVLATEWSRCARYWHHLSLLLIKLENMQDFREKQGEKNYLSLTTNISLALKNIGTRPGDLLASIGEDLFGLMLSDCSLEGAKLKAKQIMNNFDSPGFIASSEMAAQHIQCTVCVEVAAPAGGSDARELFRKAENLLFDTRQQGIGKIYVSDEILGIESLNADIRKQG